MRKVLSLTAVLIAMIVGMAAWFYKKQVGSSASSEGQGLFPYGSYQFQLHSESTGNLDVSSIAQTQGKVDVAGPGRQELSISMDAVLEVESAPRRLLFHLRQVQLKSGAQVLDAAGLGFQEQPVLVTVDPTGRFQSIGMPPWQSSMVSTVWLSLLAQLQVVRDVASTSAAWESEETDFQTRHKTKYEQSGTQLKRVKHSIMQSPLISRPRQQTLDFIETQSWQARLERGALTQLDLTDGLILMTAGQLSYRNSLAMNLKSLRYEPGLRTVAAVPATYQTFTLDLKTLEQLTLAATEADRYKKDAADITVDQIMSTLATDMSEQEETEFYKKVRGYFYTHPEVCERFVELLIESPYDGLAMRVVAVAMGRVGHPPAQKALRDIIQGRLDGKKTTTMLLTLLGQSAHPDKASLDFLQSLTTHSDIYIREAALFASGTALSHLQAFNPEESALRLEAFKTRYQTASREEKDQLIDLFGNSKMPEAIELLESEIHQNAAEPSHSLAIEALRLIDHPKARALLVNLLHNGQLKEQSAAMRALRFQPFQSEILRRSELILAGADTNSAELRKLTLEWLSQHQDEIPDLPSRLKAYLEIENNEDNRKLARSLLDVLGT